MTKIDTIAEHLAAEWDTRGPYAALTDDLRPADIAEAYDVQAALQALHTAKRGPIAGRKIALASKTMQQMVGLDQPVAGAIFANDLRDSPASLPRDSFRRLGLEYELAFRMNADIDAAAHTQDSVRALVDQVRPAFELIEDKDADYADLCALTLTADNAWCGGVVLGQPLTDWQEMDLSDTVSVLEQDGHPAEHGNTGAADPWASLAWVLNHFGGCGETIRQGEWIITGSILKTRFPGPGDRFRYTVAGQASVEIAVT
ncbi:MAG: hypothetical protein AAF557_04795 [Pseudomonadota bacterium]